MATQICDDAEVIITAKNSSSPYERALALDCERTFRQNIDTNYTKYVGYEEINECIRKLYAPETIKSISRQITKLLEGVDKTGRPILVPADTIASVIGNVYRSQSPQVGDIYTRYIIPTIEPRNDVDEIINRTIEVIVSNIRGEYEMAENNSKLTIWNTILGDFNEHGLKQTPPIKLKLRSANRFEFHMKY
jgi:hypothetical protein